MSMQQAHPLINYGFKYKYTTRWGSWRGFTWDLNEQVAKEENEIHVDYEDDQFGGDV